MRRARKTPANAPTASPAAISMSTAWRPWRRVGSSFARKRVDTRINKTAAQSTVVLRAALFAAREARALIITIPLSAQEQNLHAGRSAVLNERASPPKGRGREAEHPPEGAVEVGGVSKAGGVGGLGGRGTPCDLAQGVTQPQPEQVAADRKPELRSEEMRESARRQ